MPNRHSSEQAGPRIREGHGLLASPRNHAAGTATDLAHADLGPRSAPAVVLLHSLGTDHRLWAPQLEEFTTEFRVIAPDTRGHGSSAWDGTCSVDRWVDDLEDLLARLGVERAVVVGLSMGGVQALAYSVKHPERTAGLVVADSFAQLPPATKQAKIAATAARSRQVGMAAFADAYFHETLTVSPWPVGAEELHDAMSTMHVEAFARSAETCFGAQLMGNLRSIACPTIVIWGERDEKAPVEHSRKIVDSVDGASLHVLPDAGHLASIENPTGFNRIVDGFLDVILRDRGRLSSAPTRLSFSGDSHPRENQ